MNFTRSNNRLKRDGNSPSSPTVAKAYAVQKPDAQWRADLSPQAYRVLRGKGTERPFTGGYVESKQDGIYRCAACASALFSSETKFDSGTGWPSFTDPAVRENVELRQDRSMFMRRTEVACATCGGHLGHVFNDGPAGCDRYCINSVALALDPGAAAGGDDAA